MEQALQSANARVEELHRVLKQNVALQVGPCLKLLLPKHQAWWRVRLWLFTLKQ